LKLSFATSNRRTQRYNNNNIIININNNIVMRPRLGMWSPNVDSCGNFKRRHLLSA